MVSHVDSFTKHSGSLTYRSVGMTDTGRVRHINQDAFIERPEIGVWCIADGMGGHSEGEVASRMACDTIAGLGPTPTLEVAVEHVRRRLQSVNGRLHQAATRLINPVQSGTTVVVLIARGARCAVLWAGDSRVYRLREGHLQQLTKDHVARIEHGHFIQHAISRAVGGDAELVLDVHFDDVNPADRFLLCSDGLTHELDNSRIQELLRNQDAQQSARQAIDAALGAGGSDNVSVIVVDAHPATQGKDV